MTLLFRFHYIFSFHTGSISLQQVNISLHSPPGLATHPKHLPQRCIWKAPLHRVRCSVRTPHLQAPVPAGGQLSGLSDSTDHMIQLGVIESAVLIAFDSVVCFLLLTCSFWSHHNDTFAHFFLFAFLTQTSPSTRAWDTHTHILALYFF